MRPRGEIRVALSAAALALAPVSEAQGLTYLELAVAAQVGYQAARTATKDMVKAGELVPVGFRQVPGIKRPLRTYVAAAGGTSANDDDQLISALGLWAGAR